MTFFAATIKDWWNKKEKLEKDPHFASLHHTTVSNFQSSQAIGVQPIESLVVDPVLKQARAEEAFYAQQLNSGFQIFQSGCIDTAADEQNLRAFEDSQQPMDVDAEQAGDTIHGSMAHANPDINQMPHDLSSMPMPGSDPLAMFLGGY